MANETVSAPEQKLIVFQLKDKEYVIPVEEVKSIERPLPITRVPGTPPYIKGVMNLRGLVIPVIDLKVRLGMEEEAINEKTRIVIVLVEGHEVGFIVDGANDVIDVAKDAIEPPQHTSNEKVDEFIEGVFQYQKRIMILLKLGKVLEKEMAHF
ncbi:chemotaxis protein CheW [Bacillus carboniphilus]|uniref:Chemotaxis protein CheW n=1 Tax=Bacillus carboniphilus TaxID=86663 RepID=A0ABP3G0H3_9BACI